MFSKWFKKSRRPASYRPTLEVLEDRVTPATQVWTGAAGLFWSDPGNWESGQKPNSGDDLIFPDDALNKTNANDFINGKNFHSIRFTGSGGYTLTGNRIELNQAGTAISSSGGTNYVNLPVDFDFDAGIDPRRYDIRVNSGGTLVINGVISGGLGEALQKFGEGNLILNAVNTYTMETLIFDGTLTIQNGAALGSAQDNHSTSVLNGTLVLTNNITVPEDILVINNSGGIRSASGNNTITGTIRLLPADDFSGASRFTVDTGSKLTVTDLRDGSIEGGFNKNGNGELVIPNASSNSEDSVIANGRVTIQNNNALGTTEGDTTVLGDAELAFVGTRVIAEDLNIGHGFAFPELIALNNSDVTLTGEVHVIETARFRTIGSGKLKLTQELALDDRFDIVGGPIEFAGGMRVAGLTFLSLSGADTLNVSGGLHGTQTLQLNFTSGTGGTMLLSGPAVNTHTGFVRVNNSAALEVNNTLSSKILVAGGTLRGSGTLNTVAAFDGGTIDPGTERNGRLNIANGLSMSSASTLHIDLRNADQVRVLGGNVDLQNAILEVTKALFGTSSPDSLRIIDNLGPNPVNGTFAGLGEGATFTIDTGESFTITYFGGTGNDVVITRNTATMAPGIAVTPTIQEGQLVHLTGHLVDPDPRDRLTLVVNWGDGSRPQTFHPGTRDFDITHGYLDNGQYVVHAAWFDNHGAGNSRDLAVTVTNVDPVLSGIDVRFVGNQVFISGRIADPGRDSFTLVVHWGDGQSSTYQFAAGTDRFQVSHRYQSPGDYRVDLSLTDDDGGSDSASLRVRTAERDAWLLALWQYLDDDKVG